MLLTLKDTDFSFVTCFRHQSGEKVAKKIEKSDSLNKYHCKVDFVNLKYNTN